MTPTEHTKEELTVALAAALEVEPADIMIYNYYNAGQPGYTVILTDYRKFTGIVPVFPDQPKDEHPPVNIGGVDIPADLVPIYTNPKDHNRTDLRELGAYLQIPKARTLNKNALVRAINDYKQTSAQILTIDDASKELFE